MERENLINFKKEIQQILAKHINRPYFGKKKGLNSLPHTTLRERSLLKTLWEKKKMLVTSIFSFFHNFSVLLKPNFSCSFTFMLSSANALNFDQSKILSFGKESP